MEWFIFAIIAAVLVSAQNILEKKSLYKTHSLDLATVVSIFGFLFMIPLIFKVNFNLSFDIISLIYVASLVSTFAFWFAAKAIHHFNITTSIPLLALSPAVTAIFAYMFLEESLTLLEISGILLMILGTYVLKIERNLSNLGPFKKLIHSKYSIYILLSLLFYGIAAMYDRFILNPLSAFQVSPITYIFYLQLFTMVNYLVLMFLLNNGFRGVKSCTKKAGIGMLIILSLLITASRVSYAYAVSLMYVALVYAIVKSSAFFSTIIGGEIFHEKHLLKKSIAALIIILGACLLII